MAKLREILLGISRKITAKDGGYSILKKFYEKNIFRAFYI